LLKQRRFAPFFWTQFAGAANDNLFKFAFTVMVTYQLQLSWMPPAMAGLAIGALFILPFLLFSATAGQLTDKFDKTKMIRFVKNLEIAIMLIAAWGFVTANAVVLLGCVFLMGLHSTLFGPVKFAYLPQVLDARELTGGNGMVEMGTFVAILLGQVAGGLLVAVPQIGHTSVAVACVLLALAGRGVAQAIPQAPATDPGPGHQLEPLQRNLAQPEARARQRGGVPFAAGHFVDVVLRRGVPEPVPQLRQGSAARRRAGGLAAAGGVLDRHRRRFAAVRDAEPPAGGNRPGAAGRHRHERVRHRPVLCLARRCRRWPRWAWAPSCTRARTGA
jgi:MFS family permease